MGKRKHALCGRTAVVTGAARGIGAAVAGQLAARGFRVALLGLEERGLAQVAEGLPTTSWCWPVDVTDAAEMGCVAGEIRERYGPVSVVVANAGVAQAALFAEAEPADWRRVIDVNLIGSANTARAFIPQLLDTGGYFLQVASLASIGAVPVLSAYCASKAGVESLSHSLRAELPPRGVGVGIAYLNWTDTGMIRDTSLRELREQLPPPARRVRSPDDVAARLASAIERRVVSVYVPGWLRPLQVVRTGLTPLVSRLVRPEVLRPSAPSSGLIGPGGRAAKRGGP
ncbi:SDR family oxidoreductase [Streptomyces sp. NPDC001661]